MNPLHLLTTLCLLSFACFSCGGDMDGAEDGLSASAVAFIELWFPERNVLESTSREALLDDGTRLCFDDRGEWVYIRAGERVALPSGIVSGAVAGYLAEHCGQSGILLLRRDSRGLEVGLDAGCLAVFSPEGLFLELRAWHVVDHDVGL